MAGRGGAAARAVRRCCSSSRARSHSTAAAAAAEPGPPPPLYVRSAATTAADAMGVLGLAAGKRGDRPGARPVDSLAHLVKRPSDSLLCVELPFGRDAALRAANVNWRGQLRVGKLLEELDAFAGAIAYRHVDDGDPGSEQPTLVTASTDRVDLVTYPLRADQDMQMRGMVTYVGASSLNIDVDIVALPAQRGAPLQPVLLASTTFVARNRRTGRALPVPRLAPATPRELQLHEAGRLASEARRAARGAGLDRVPPSAAELGMVHTLFQELGARQAGGGRSGGGGGGSGSGGSGATRVMMMDDTLLTSSEITMPQDRNVHGKVFGGWLMRRAFETAWAAGWRATGTLPKFLALDDISFDHPVEVGSLVRFDARLDYSLGAGTKTYGVSVSATMSRPHEAADAELQRGRLTNTFHFVFYTDEPERLPRVYPRSYVEAMQWIEAHRRMELGRTLAERRKAEGARVRFD